jgi:hypothetical protein
MEIEFRKLTEEEIAMLSDEDKEVYIEAYNRYMRNLMDDYIEYSEKCKAEREKYKNKK